MYRIFFFTTHSMLNGLLTISRQWWWGRVWWENKELCSFQVLFYSEITLRHNSDPGRKKGTILKIKCTWCLLSRETSEVFTSKGYQIECYKNIETNFFLIYKIWNEKSSRRYIFRTWKHKQLMKMKTEYIWILTTN